MQELKPIPVEKCTHHIFLSITGNVLKHAVDLKERLEKLGYKSWIYTEVFDDRLMEKMLSGVKKSVIFVALITTDYFKSEYCLKEIRLAGILKKPIIPIVYEQLEAWPPEEIIMQVLDTIYIGLFNNNNEWNDELFSHLITRLPPSDIIKIDSTNASRRSSYSRSRSPSRNEDNETRKESLSPPSKYPSIPGSKKTRSRSRSIERSSDEVQGPHNSRKPLQRSPSQDVTLFHEIDNWPALSIKNNDDD